MIWYYNPYISIGNRKREWGFYTAELGKTSETPKSKTVSVSSLCIQRGASWAEGNSHRPSTGTPGGLRTLSSRGTCFFHKLSREPRGKMWCSELKLIKKNPCTANSHSKVSLTVLSTLSTLSFSNEFTCS